jgi:hypothetical protein
MFDALPTDLRAITVKLVMPACVPFQLLIQLALYLNWAENPSLVIHAFGHFSYSASSIAASALSNVILVCALNALYGFNYPTSLVMVKSRTETFVLSERELLVLRAIDKVSKMTAEENTRDDVVSKAGKILSQRISSFYATSRLSKTKKIGVSEEGP